MERIISELEMPNEVEIQKSLRPKSFDEYIGQENLKEKMSISIKANSKYNHLSVRAAVAIILDRLFGEK